MTPRPGRRCGGWALCAALCGMAAQVSAVTVREALEAAVDQTVMDSSQQAAFQVLLHASDLYDKGNAEESVPLWRRALEMDPGCVPAALALLQTARSSQEPLDEYDPAFMRLVDQLDRATAPAPPERDPYGNYRVTTLLGLQHIILDVAGERNSAMTARAIAVGERCVAMAPDTAVAHLNYGIALERGHDLEAARREFARCTELDPNVSSCVLNQANTHFRQSNMAAAVEGYRAALKVPGLERANHVAILSNMAHAQMAMQDSQGATVTLREALRLQPSLSLLRVNLFLAHRMQLDFAYTERERDTVVERLASTGGEGCLVPYDATLLAVGASWLLSNAAITAQVWQSIALVDISAAARDIDAGQRTARAEGRRPRLHVALVGHDFFDHPMGRLTQGMVTLRDPAALTVSVWTYATVRTETVERALFQHKSDLYRDIYALPDGRAAAAIAEEQPHIAVDLMAHTQNMRVQILAHKPAPILINYLGFPGTSGTRFHDYIILDRSLVRVEAGDAATSEYVVLMPHCYQANFYTLDTSLHWMEAARFETASHPLHRMLEEAEAQQTHAQRDASLAVALRRGQVSLWSLLRPSVVRAAVQEAVLPEWEPGQVEGARRLDRAAAWLHRRAHRLLAHWATRQHGRHSNFTRVLAPAADPRAPGKVLPSGRASQVPPPGAFVFVCFNKADKLQRPVLDAWWNTLRRTPRGVLMLVRMPSTETQPSQRNLRKLAAASGVHPSRLRFSPSLRDEWHRARHAHGHLFLDTQTYTAHTTAADALWEGLPLLACGVPGHDAPIPSRVSASLLEAAALPELVTHSLRDCEAVAARLAHGKPLLSAHAAAAARAAAAGTPRMGSPDAVRAGYQTVVRALHRRLPLTTAWSMPVTAATWAVQSGGVLATLQARMARLVAATPAFDSHAQAAWQRRAFEATAEIRESGFRRCRLFSLEQRPGPSGRSRLHTHVTVNRTAPATECDPLPRPAGATVRSSLWPTGAHVVLPRGPPATEVATGQPSSRLARRAFDLYHEASLRDGMRMQGASTTSLRVSAVCARFGARLWSAMQREGATRPLQPDYRLDRSAQGDGPPDAASLYHVACVAASPGRRDAAAPVLGVTHAWPPQTQGEELDEVTPTGDYVGGLLPPPAPPLASLHLLPDAPSPACREREGSSCAGEELASAQRAVTQFAATVAWGPDGGGALWGDTGEVLRDPASSPAAQPSWLPHLRSLVERGRLAEVRSELARGGAPARNPAWLPYWFAAVSKARQSGNASFSYSLALLLADAGRPLVHGLGRDDGGGVTSRALVAGAKRSLEGEWAYLHQHMAELTHLGDKPPPLSLRTIAQSLTVAPGSDVHASAVAPAFEKAHEMTAATMAAWRHGAMRHADRHATWLHQQPTAAASSSSSPDPQSLRPGGSLVVAFYCDEYGQTWWPHWGKHSLAQGALGGAEEAVTRVAKELARVPGVHVEVYTEALAENHGRDEEGVVWTHFDKYDVSRPADVFVAWRYWLSLAVGASAPQRYIYLQDHLTKYLVEDPESVRTWSQGLTGVFALSQFAASPFSPGHKRRVWMAPNAAGASSAAPPVRSNDNRVFIYASNPLRGLGPLLLMWPKIRAALPNAELRVYYGITDAVDKHARANLADWDTAGKPRLLRLLQQPGVRYIGAVDHFTLDHAYAEAGFLLYPTGYPEVGCIACAKAMAFGAIPVTSRWEHSVLPELIQDYDLGPPREAQYDGEGQARLTDEWTELYVRHVVQAATQDPAALERHRQAMVAFAQSAVTWRNTARRMLTAVRHRGLVPPELRSRGAWDPAWTSAVDQALAHPVNSSWAVPG